MHSVHMCECGAFCKCRLRKSEESTAREKRDSRKETHLSETTESGSDKDARLNPHKQPPAHITGFTGKLQPGQAADILMTTLDKIT